MKDLNKYVGIPYGFNCDTYDSADCAGLAAMFYKDHGWIPNEYPKPTSTDWYIKNPYYMERFLLKHFDKTRDISELTYGDLAVVHVNGEAHLFIYLGYDKVLTTYPKVNEFNGGVSFIDRLQRYWLQQKGVKFISGFKRRT